MLNEALAQERIVRGVLQQPPHQVPHARKQFAEGRVYAHPLPQFHQSGFDCVAHAVEHLELNRPLGQAQAPGCRQGLGDGANVVGRDRWSYELIVFQEDCG